MLEQAPSWRTKRKLGDWATGSSHLRSEGDRPDGAKLKQSPNERQAERRATGVLISCRKPDLLPEQGCGSLRVAEDPADKASERQGREGSRMPGFCRSVRR